MVKRILLPIGLLLTAALLLAACQDLLDRTNDVDNDDTPVPEEPTPTPTQEPDVDPTPPEDVSEQVAHGQEIYENDCMACHGPDGEGAEDDGFRIPNLNQNSLVVADNPAGAISTILTGRGGMPRFSGLDDEEIADVMTFLRQEWDNDAAPVEPEAVEEMREEIYGED
jgi:cytochrome c6